MNKKRQNKKKSVKFVEEDEDDDEGEDDNNNNEDDIEEKRNEIKRMTRILYCTAWIWAILTILTLFYSYRRGEFKDNISFPLIFLILCSIALPTSFWCFYAQKFSKKKIIKKPVNL